MLKLTAALLLTLPLLSVAQAAPSLDCVVNSKGKVTKMYWYAPNQSHHSGPELEYLNVQVLEKADPGKYEIVIVESVEDQTWDQFSSLVTAAKLDQELRKNILALGRTRMTRAFVGLYAGVLHYESSLGTDANLFEISCASRK